MRKNKMNVNKEMNDKEMLDLVQYLEVSFKSGEELSRKLSATIVETHFKGNSSIAALYGLAKTVTAVVKAQEESGIVQPMERFRLMMEIAASESELEKKLNSKN